MNDEKEKRKESPLSGSSWHGVSTCHLWPGWAVNRCLVPNSILPLRMNIFGRRMLESPVANDVIRYQGRAPATGG